MSSQWAFLAMGIPFFTALIMGSVGYAAPRFMRWIGATGITLAVFASIGLWSTVSTDEYVSYFFGGWLPPIGIALEVDRISALMVLMVHGVAALAYIFSLKALPNELPASKHPVYYTLYFLLISGFVALAVTGDVFNVYVLFEVCALSGYALLAMGGKKAYVPTFNYVLMGSLGACFYLIGVGYLFIKTGTLNMAHLADVLPTVFFSRSILTAFILITVGLFVKMALFPFHGWMPNVYTKAPVSTLCLMAPLGTKICVYVLLRVVGYVFSMEYMTNILAVQPIMMTLATLAIVVGTLYVVYHRHLTRIIMFIIVSEIGYMVGGIFLGQMDSVIGAVYHIAADALMTVTLVMVAGVVRHCLGGDAIADVAMMFRRLPTTAIAFVIVCLSVIGVPPMPGFFSKFLLIKGAFMSGYYGFAVALLIASLTAVFLFFRFFEGYFYMKTDNTAPSVIQEPWAYRIPLVVAAIGLVGFGLSFSYWYGFIKLALPLGLA